MQTKNKPRIIALYLPQFHPIPENDDWWGKGFTEWRNVGKAKPLFRGHYQPKVPRDLGYYDLRLEETRIQQAILAQNSGIEGFCYWHYWFGDGKRLLERPFDEVLKSGKPNFPFCLGWANHSWKAKTWTPSGEDTVLIEQKYSGTNDFVNHFYSVLPAFLDNRYIRIKNKPFFLIWDPRGIPNIKDFIKLWNSLAKENGLEGIHFVASATQAIDINEYKVYGFDAVSLDFMLKSFQNRRTIRKSYFRIKRALFSIPKYMDYDEYSKYVINNLPIDDFVYPSIVPNFDHSPRSGKLGQVIVNESPKKFQKLLNQVFSEISYKISENNIVILRSWNEWGEGNYLEPDIKHGSGFLDAIKEELDKCF